MQEYFSIGFLGLCGAYILFVSSTLALKALSDRLDWIQIIKKSYNIPHKRKNTVSLALGEVTNNY